MFCYIRFCHAKHNYQHRGSLNPRINLKLHNGKVCDNVFKCHICLKDRTIVYIILTILT
jgi:hypothetical protein